jgi:hypothetical protein
MPNPGLQPGELVKVITKPYDGLVGIVSQPIAQDQPGHVLVCKEGCIIGVQASLQDVTLADKSSEGFAQLAYNLIQLGSRVIEARLIV